MNPDLDSFDPAVRRQALLDVCANANWPAPTNEVNLHAHTFFSYNAYGYSPTHFAVLARQRGLAVAGIVDFDVLDGADEFYEAGRLLGLKTVASIETRVFVPEFATRVINSPGERGIAYYMGVGFPRFVEHPTLRRTAEQRNRELVARVNTLTAPVTLDYDRDVLPLTPNGNATERHICEAYAKKGGAEFWRKKLGEGNPPALIRAKLMKKDRADPDSFPTIAEFNRFILNAGAIPTLAWLDGTSEGEQDIEELFEVSGAAALNVIPDRNFANIQNLYDVVALANKRGWPVIAGTEMNAPGNKFVDDFQSAELKPLVPDFLEGARIVHEHVRKQRIS